MPTVFRVFFSRYCHAATRNGTSDLLIAKLFSPNRNRFGLPLKSRRPYGVIAPALRRKRIAIPTQSRTHLIAHEML